MGEYRNGCDAYDLDAITGTVESAIDTTVVDVLVGVGTLHARESEGVASEGAVILHSEVPASLDDPPIETRHVAGLVGERVALWNC